MLSSKYKLQAINSFNILDEVSRQNFFAITLTLTLTVF